VVEKKCVGGHWCLHLTRKDKKCRYNFPQSSHASKTRESSDLPIDRHIARWLSPFTLFITGQEVRYRNENTDYIKKQKS
jgi:hypothetical protein